MPSAEPPILPGQEILSSSVSKLISFLGPQILIVLFVCVPDKLRVSCPVAQGTTEAGNHGAGCLAEPLPPSEPRPPGVVSFTTRPSQSQAQDGRQGSYYPPPQHTLPLISRATVPREREARQGGRGGAKTKVGMHLRPLGSLQPKGSGLVPRTSPALVIGREDPAGPLSWDLGDQLSP